MYKSYETLMEYLETERDVYNDMLQTLENFERGKSRVNLNNIEKLLNILEKNDIKISDERTAKRTVQSAIFLHAILSDLVYLVRNSNLDNRTKEIWINKLHNLLNRTKRIIDDYYDYYAISLGTIGIGITGTMLTDRDTSSYPIIQNLTTMTNIHQKLKSFQILKQYGEMLQKDLEENFLTLFLGVSYV